MLGKEIHEKYDLIEYLSSTPDNKWYKLKDHYPFCFGRIDDPEVIVLDTGGQQGAEMGQYKIKENKLIRLNWETHEWEIITDIRLIEKE